MNEKDLFKKAISTQINKEHIRKHVLSSVEGRYRKVNFNIKKRIVICAVAVLIFCVGSFSAYAVVDAYEFNQATNFLGEIGIESSELSRSDAKKVYKDIKSDAFEYETTLDVLNARAEELGIETEYISYEHVQNNSSAIPGDINSQVNTMSAKEIYKAIVEYNGLVHTAKITNEQIRTIKAGTTYKDIIKMLGNTKDIGSGLHVLQYSVDNDKIFYLSFADENDICNQSGEKLLKTLENAPQGNTDKNTFNATLIQRYENSILVSCPTYDRFDTINLTITNDTIIEFSNGQKATIDDIKYGMIITVADQVSESYPPQGTALKIVIKK